MNRARLENEISDGLAEIEERQRRVDSGEVTFWQSPEPPRRRTVVDATIKAFTERIAAAAVADAVAQAEARLDEGLHEAGRAIGEEVSAIVNPILDRLRAAEKTIDELKARQWAAPPTIIRP